MIQLLTVLLSASLNFEQAANRTVSDTRHATATSGIRIEEKNFMCLSSLLSKKIESSKRWLMPFRQEIKNGKNNANGCVYKKDKEKLKLY